ncbi:MAG: hypothetical protein KC502_12185 [Myxococcales bacterium]|nr:hypothetical protein [Myxococcales bacterium]
MGADEHADPRPGITAAIGMAVVPQAQLRWLASEGDGSLRSFIDEAFATLTDVAVETAAVA